MGIDIQAKEERKIRSAGRRITVLLSDVPCLSCMGLLNPQALAVENSEQGYQGYVAGMNIQNSSVISLNGVVASLGVTEFLNLLTGFERRRSSSTYQLYDILKGEIWRESMKVAEKCGVCDEVKGLGDNIARATTFLRALVS